MRPGPIRRLAGDRRGGVSMMVAVAASALIGCAALAVDLGSVYLHSRKLQGVADLAALAAANDIGRAQAAAEATVASNGMSGPTQVQVVLGGYSPDPNTPAAQRFQAGAASPTAVRVTLTRQAPLTFGVFVLGKPSVDISRAGTATQTQLASLSIGSRLASLDGGVANALLSGLTGSQISLSVMDYRALAAAKIDLLKYTPALATKLNLGAASFDQILKSEVTAPQALGALADLLTTEGKTAEAASIRLVARASGNVGKLKMSELLDLGVYANQDHASKSSQAKVEVSALDLTRAVLTTGQEGRQVALNLSAALPGLVDTKAFLAIGERPNNSAWLTVTRDKGVIIRTAQMRLFVEASVGASGLGAGALVRLPVMVELAEGKARLEALNCNPGQVTVMAAPGIGRLAIGEVDKTQLNNFKTELAVTEAKVVSLPLISVGARALTQVGGDQWSQLTFSSADIAAGTVKTVSTRNALQGTTTTLLGQTTLSVNLLGLSLGLGNNQVTQTVTERLGVIAAPLDGVVNGLTDLLGVRLGELDVKVNGLRCRDPVLVA